MEEVQTLRCLTAKHETQQNQLSTSTVQSGISANGSSINESLIPRSLIQGHRPFDRILQPFFFIFYFFGVRIKFELLRELYPPFPEKVLFPFPSTILFLCPMCSYFVS